jgi:hypothetical protein
MGNVSNTRARMCRQICNSCLQQRFVANHGCRRPESNFSTQKDSYCLRSIVSPLETLQSWLFVKERQPVILYYIPLSIGARYFNIRLSGFLAVKKYKYLTAHRMSEQQNYYSFWEAELEFIISTMKAMAMDGKQLDDAKLKNAGYTMKHGFSLEISNCVTTKTPDESEAAEQLADLLLAVIINDNELRHKHFVIRMGKNRFLRIESHQSRIAAMGYSSSRNIRKS